MNTKIKSIALSVMTVALLTACGSDSSDGDKGDGVDGTPEAPIAEYTCEKTVGSSVQKLGATGAFGVECTDVDQRLIFTDDINELAIANVVTTASGQFTEDGIVISYEETVDYATGTTHRKGSHSTEGSFDCTLIYDVGEMPQTIYAAYEIERFFWVDENEDQLISSTCPDWMNDDDDNDNGNDESAEEFSNSVITDAQGNESTVSMYFKGNWGDFDDDDNDN